MQVSALEDALVWGPLRQADSLMHSAASMVDLSALAADLAADLAMGEGTQLDAGSSLGGGRGPFDGVDGGNAGLGQSGSGLGPRPLRRVELVLLHSQPGLPRGTAAWLDARQLLTRHHHIRPHLAADIARLSRWMAGACVHLRLPCAAVSNIFKRSVPFGICSNVCVKCHTHLFCFPGTRKTPA